MANASVPNPRYHHAPALRHVCKACGKQFLAYSVKQLACCVACKFEMYQNKGDLSLCWEWAGPINNQGYGVLFLDTNKENGRRMVTAAHRYSFVEAGGVLTDDKPCVLHRCDNRKCTNPAHLFTGDWADNNADRSKKGRSGARVYSDDELQAYRIRNQGESHPQAKLTEAQARDIKYGLKQLNGPQVAAIFGINRHSVNAIRRGCSWRHI